MSEAVIKACYECYDDFMYASVGFDGAEEAEAYVAELIETRTVVYCPQCQRTVNYGGER